MAQESTELRKRVVSRHFRRHVDIFNRQVWGVLDVLVQSVGGLVLRVRVRAVVYLSSKAIINMSPDLTSWYGNQRGLMYVVHALRFWYFRSNALKSKHLLLYL